MRQAREKACQCGDWAGLLYFGWLSHFFTFVYDLNKELEVVIFCLLHIFKFYFLLASIFMELEHQCSHFVLITTSVCCLCQRTLVEEGWPKLLVQPTIASLNHNAELYRRLLDGTFQHNDWGGLSYNGIADMKRSQYWQYRRDPYYQCKTTQELFRQDYYCHYHTGNTGLSSF